MRISRWKDKEVFSQIREVAIAQAEAIMDDLVSEAKSRTPVSPIVREGKWSGHRIISFKPRRGRSKGQSVSFTAKRWLGRQPGDLRSTIRKVTKRDRRGNIRVYAGNTKIYWAFMVERGTSKTKAVRYLKNAFEHIQATAKERLEKSIKVNVPELS
jgi:hypothetical protein